MDRGNVPHSRVTNQSGDRAMPQKKGSLTFLGAVYMESFKNSKKFLKLPPAVLDPAGLGQSRGLLLCRLPLPHGRHWHPEGTAGRRQQGGGHMVRGQSYEPIIFVFLFFFCQWIVFRFPSQFCSQWVVLIKTSNREKHLLGSKRIREKQMPARLITKRRKPFNVYFLVVWCYRRKSLDLVETLLKLAEAGKYEQVKSLFSFPIKHCPDMLLLALLQVQVCRGRDLWHRRVAAGERGRGKISTCVVRCVWKFIAISVFG